MAVLDYTDTQFPTVLPDSVMFQGENINMIGDSCL